jgi:hypothetical protein
VAGVTRAIEKPVLVNADGTPTKEGWRKIGELFRQPMPHKQFKGKGGRTFDYVTARQVQDRLDTIVGPGNWGTSVRVVRAEHPVSVLVGVRVFGVWKWDAGYSNNPDADDEFIPMLENGEPVVDQKTGEVKTKRNPVYEDEPLKAAVSDGFKRAAVQWGIGRFLYGD